MGKRLTSLVLVVLVVGLALPHTGGAALVGWWQLDDGAGATAVDSSGNGFNGVIEGDPEWVNGVFGGALQLGGDADTVRIPPMNLDTTAGATMTAWIKPAESQSDWCGVIFARGGGEAGIWITNARELRYSWGSAQAWNFNPGFVAPADEWSFVALVVTPSSGTMYFNGESNAYQAAHPAYGFTSDTLLGLDPQNANKYFEGTIDDCRIYDHALTAEEVQGARPEPATKAVKPVPVSGATDVRRDVVLSWEPGPYAATHNVYFGTSLDDVNNASLADPLGVLVAAGQDANTYDPLEILELGQTYYWRVDEVNAAPDTTTFKGNVWSFETEPFAYLVADITATASTTGGDLNNAINGSGLNADGTHVTTEADMWLGDAVEGEPIWVRYDFDRAYKVQDMHIWNYNGPYEAFLGFGPNDVTIEYATDAENWITLGDFQLAHAPGNTSYAGQTIGFGGVAAKSVRISIHNNWGTQLRYGLSEVRFYYVPAHARGPQPASGATGVSLNPVLSWRAGREAVSHEVSLDANPQAVADGAAVVDTTSEASYSLGSLDLGTTYYWKVDEVNQAEAISTWEGDIWNFTTQQYAVVDNFESYTDNVDAEETVFQTWLDGYGIGSNGSLVGNENPPFAVPASTHSGSQAMPLSYDNSGTATSSVAERTFDGPQDWTEGTVDTLVLYFYGDPDNNANEPMWVRLTDQSGKTGTVTYGAGAAEGTDNQTIAAWHEWSIPLAGFGVDVTKVTAIAIGFGGTGPRSAGLMLFDDIRLYPSRPAGTPALAAHWTLDGNANDSSANGNNGVLNGGATWVAAGKMGGALSLNGTDAYVDGGNGASLNITEAITLSAWVNPADANNAEHNPFVTKGDQAYAIKHNTSNQIECFIYDDTWYTAAFPIDDSFNGEWHHVASTYDGLHLRLYVDGALRATLEHAGSIAAGTFNVNIGRNAQNTDRLYNGLIDEVRIYDGALPPAEIAQLATP